MKTRARTLIVALLLALLGSAAGIVLYSLDENTLPTANKVGDYIIHLNALANVNIAARLYNVAKGGEIVISETTYQEVKDAVEVVEMEPVMVKGKTVPSASTTSSE